MKAKLKLDPQAIKTFFLQHGEKIVLGLTGIMFCLFTYGAATRPTYIKTAAGLESEARRARNNIDEKKREPRKPLDYGQWDDMARQSRRPVSEQPYAFNVPWNPPLFPERHKRDIPKIYAVEKLAGTADMGQFALRETPAGGAVAAVVAPGAEQAGATVNRGQRWVVLTGLVPWSAQVAAYQGAFRDNPREGFDAPVYMGYRVARAEVAGPRDNPPPEAYKQNEVISANKLESVKGRWSTPPQEVAATSAINDILTYPLGPLNGAWDWRVAHPPDVPLQSAVPEAASAPPPKAATSQEDLDLTLRGKPDATGQPAAKPDKAPASPKAGSAAAAAAPGDDVKFLLFRYFDFNVERGKKYRYRVQLLLKNPNFGADVRTVRDPEYTKDRYLEDKWSAPSEVIAIPGDDLVFVQAMKTDNKREEVFALNPSSRLEEVTANLGLVKWMPEDGRRTKGNIAKQYRGQLCDYVKGDKEVVSDVAGPEGEVAAGGLLGGATATPAKKNLSGILAGGMGLGPAKPAKKPQPAGVDFNTEFLLIDFRGGPAGRGDAARADAAEVLFLAPDGQMSIRSELDDKVELDRVVTKVADAGGGDAGAAPAGGSGLFGGAPPSTAKEKPGRTPPKRAGKTAP